VPRMRRRWWTTANGRSDPESQKRDEMRIRFGIVIFDISAIGIGPAAVVESQLKMNAAKRNPFKAVALP